MKLLKIIGGVVVGVVAVAAVPFTGGGSLLAGAAALGLGTATAVATAVAVGAAGGIFGSLWDGDEGDKSDVKRKLGIIGMKNSGKTTFLFNLGGIKKIVSSTSTQNYEAFNYTTKSGIIVQIEKGRDIGGGKNYISDYKDIIGNNNVTFFFFDINRYLNEIEYSRDCNSRLSFIFPILENKKFVLIGSHADQSKLIISELREQIIERTINKNYSKVFNENFFIENLTNANQFSNLIENLFK